MKKPDRIVDFTNVVVVIDLLDVRLVRVSPADSSTSNISKFPMPSFPILVTIFQSAFQREWYDDESPRQKPVIITAQMLMTRKSTLWS